MAGAANVKSTSAGSSTRSTTHVVPARAQVAELACGARRPAPAGRRSARPGRACGPTRRSAPAGGERSVERPAGSRSSMPIRRRRWPGAMPRRQVVGDLLVEREQADRVALREQEIGERRGQRAGVLALGVRRRAEAHRAAQVDEQVAAQVRLVLEPLDVVAVGAGEEPPVEIARVVAGRVRAILAELDREAVVRAAMDAGVETLRRRRGRAAAGS